MSQTFFVRDVAVWQHLFATLIYHPVLHFSSCNHLTLAAPFQFASNVGSLGRACAKRSQNSMTKKKAARRPFPTTLPCPTPCRQTHPGRAACLRQRSPPRGAREAREVMQHVYTARHLFPLWQQRSGVVLWGGGGCDQVWSWGREGAGSFLGFWRCENASWVYWSRRVGQVSCKPSGH